MHDPTFTQVVAYGAMIVAAIHWFMQCFLCFTLVAISWAIHGAQLNK